MVPFTTKHLLIHGILYGILVTTVIGCSFNNEDNVGKFSKLDIELKKYVDEILNKDTYKIINGVSIEPKLNTYTDLKMVKRCNESEMLRKTLSIDDYIEDRYEAYANTHVLSIKTPETGRLFKSFGLKKLLLPIFIGAQILKSVLIAMFLPSILGSIGKLVGKGLSQASTVSGSSGHQQQPIEDFDFKDTGTPYNAAGTEDDYAAVPAHDYNFPAATGTTTLTATQQAMNRFGNDGFYPKVSYVRPQSDNYYLRRPNKQHDYKVFHKIPNSSLLLTTYDPFYSPLLSRLDAVFQQLGLGASTKGPQQEKCRERLVCLMYANPTKYAPYSNLVSAQLSRELNELRKPASDNPEILRFFRYMKAAKDGQDGGKCFAYNDCPALQITQGSPAMLTTYNDINKLIDARFLH